MGAATKIALEPISVQPKQRFLPPIPRVKVRRFVLLVIEPIHKDRDSEDQRWRNRPEGKLCREIAAPKSLRRLGVCCAKLTVGLLVLPAQDSRARVAGWSRGPSYLTRLPAGILDENARHDQYPGACALL